MWPGGWARSSTAGRTSEGRRGRTQRVCVYSFLSLPRQAGLFLVWFQSLGSADQTAAGGARVSQRCGSLGPRFTGRAI